MNGKPNNTDETKLEAPACSGSSRPVPEVDPVDLDLLAELHQARKDRVAQIKSAIDAGQYDSDELLNAALERMLEQVVSDEVDDNNAEVKPREDC